MRLTNSVVNFVPALVDGVQQDAIDPMLRSVADFVSRDDRIGSTVESVMNWLLQGFAMIGHLVPQFNGSPGEIAKPHSALSSLVQHVDLFDCP